MIEAMKQALEALEDFVDVIKYDNEQDDIGRRACCDVLSYNPHSESCKAKQAITAIKEAIREHAMYEVQRLGQEIEQEAVAWKLMPRDATDAMLKAMDECSTEGYDERLYAGHAASVYMAAWDALDTHPPQRTWVGLTDEEIYTESRSHEKWAKDGSEWFSRGSFARAIEAKLKEKNND